MDFNALAPGVRMALNALGFKPEQIVQLMQGINDGIADNNTRLQKIEDRQADTEDLLMRVLAALEKRKTDGETNGRRDNDNPSAGNHGSTGQLLGPTGDADDAATRRENI